MERIMYRDTNGISPAVDRRTAILESQPPSGGLYVPTYAPKFKQGEIKSLRGASLPEVDYAITKKFLGDVIPDEYIQKMSEEALNFPIPIEHVYGNVFTERQGFGPTGAFKDTAARKLARETSYYITQTADREWWLLVATSGDTGAAIRGGFYGVPGVNVIIGYPRNNVTPTQAALMNRYGNNILALAFDGSFGDIQEIFMTAFADPDLKKFNLFSANSINIGRAQPQAVHAVYPLTDERVMESGRDPVFVVPSGNFGHTYAFLLAKDMGAFDEQIVVANNSNNVFDRFMKTGQYEVTDVIKTISNAMDVDDPSNSRRIFDMFGGKLIRDRQFTTKEGKNKVVCRISKMPDMYKMREAMYTTSISDEKTEETIKRIYEETQGKAIFEPHGAVGMAAVKEYSKTRSDEPTYVSMSTAHNGKFPEVLEKLGIPVEQPDYMKEVVDKPSFAINKIADYGFFKGFMLSGEAERVISKQKLV